MSEDISQIISNIHFIPDVPLRDEKELKFGHEDIAKSIKDIVLNAEQSMTIGLFGSWGTGKSSIVHSLEKILENEEKHIPIIIFDVWKHKDDALRRTFLYDCVKQLKDKNQIPKKTNIENSVSKTIELTEEKSRFDKNNLWIPIIVVLLISGSLYFSLSSALPPSSINYSLIITSLISGIAITFGIWLPKNLNFVFKKSTTKIIEDKFSDPAQFEKEFKSIIVSSCSYTETDKILIVFDNLDRVTEEKAVEVLATIKTFLEPKLDEKEIGTSIIFLIPCDNKAIQKHIKNMYFLNGCNSAFNDNERESEEFLNKFFNCQITIPEFFPSEFEQFALSQLKKSGIPKFQTDSNILNNVAWIIVRAYRSNPRRIINFINDLSALYILLLYRVDSGNFKLDFIDENLPQIAKYLVIEKKYPEYIPKMMRAGYASPETYVNMANTSSSDDEFKEFINSTRDIEINNIYLFSRLQLSENEKKFPGIQYLFYLMDNLEKDETIEFIKKMNFSKELELAFSHALKDELENKIIPQIKRNFIESILIIKEKTQINLSKELIKTIFYKVEKDPIILLEIKPSLIHQTLISPISFPSRIAKIIEYWISFIPRLQSEYRSELLNMIFSEEITINKHLIDKYFNSLNEIEIDNEVVDLISKLPFDKQEKHLNSNFIKKIVISEYFISTERGFQEINNISTSLIQKDILNEIIIKIEEYLKNIFDGLNTQSQKECCINLAIFINRNKNQFVTLFKDNNELYQEFNSFLIGVSRKTKNQSDSLPFLIEFSMITKEISNQNVHNAIIERINQLINVDPTELKSILNENLVQKLYEIDKEHINQLILNQQKIGLYSIIFSGLTKIQKTQLLESTINANKNYAILAYNKLIRDKLKPEVSQKFLTDIIQEMKQNPSAYPIDQKIQFLEICNFTKCFENPEIIGNYLELTQILLIPNDQSSRTRIIATFKNSTFTPQDRKRGLIKKLHMEFINDTYPINIEIIEYIISNMQELTKEEKDAMIQKLFDKTLIEQNPQMIKDLLGLLGSLKPQYNHRKQNFEDLKNKIETEGNVNIKNSLKEGLLSLKPNNPTSDDTIKYWSVIENL